MSNTHLHIQTEDRKKILGKKQKKLRGKQITQEELAKRLNFSRQTINNWENGRSVPSVEQLHKYAEMYNVSLDYLFGYSEFTKPENEYLEG